MKTATESKGTSPDSGDRRIDPAQGDAHDRELIRRHLALSPRERLEALQAFVDDVLRLRGGRPAEIR